MSAQKDYKRRHGKACVHLHWCLSQLKYDTESVDKWYSTSLPKSLKNERAKIL